MRALYILNIKNLNMQKENTAIEWIEPEVKKLGNASELVKNVNVQGAGDSQFSVLDPS
tara:strand:- start:203 stop:376 length:174 start_codon:yes stop_codon:yes gene_type:complete